LEVKRIKLLYNCGGPIMEIIEVKWLNNNKANLSIEDIERLNQYSFFEQSQNRSFEMKFKQFLNMCKDALEIYEKHNPRVH
jgi:hypothetical protein